MKNNKLGKTNAYICAFAIGLGLAVAAVLAPCWWSVATGSGTLPKCTPGQSDFIVFVASAKMVANGEAPALYDLDQQRAAQLAIDPTSPHVMPFFYAPFYGAVLSTLSWMSFGQAFVVMTAVNIAILLISVTILVRRLELRSRQTKWLLVSIACNMGVYYTLLQAQTSFISLLLMTLVVTGARTSAGIWAGLLFFKPSLGIAPLLALMAKRRWPAVGAAAVTGTALAAVSLFLVGFEGVADYRAMSLKATSSHDPLQMQADAMFNLRGLIVATLGVSFDRIWILGSIAILAAALARLAKGGSWGVFVIGMLLAAPHLHGHDLTLLVIPAAFFLKTRADLTPWTAAGLLLLGMLPLINNIIAAPPLITIALIIVFCAMCWGASLGDSKN